MSSTIDESTMGESIVETKSIKSGKSKTKSKVRASSGISHFNKKKGRFRGTKNADLMNDESDTSNSYKMKQTSGRKVNKRMSSKSPFPQKNSKNIRKSTAKDEKSTDADEDSKVWGLIGNGIDKKNCTKGTYHTNSENEDNPWVKSKGKMRKKEMTGKVEKIGKRKDSKVKTAYK